jgi:branched-chain amino acid transport system substrate-binding protein
MKSKKLVILNSIICLALLVMMIPFINACGGEDTTGKTLKVGIMTPTTGPAAEKGVPLRDANLDCIQYINEELGGVNGYQIEAINLDSQYKADQAVININQFMDQGCLFFTTSASAEMSWVQEIANRAGFPGLVCYSSPSNYHPPEHIYGQTPDYGDDWIAFTNYYLENIWKGTGKPKMALMLLNNSTGAGARNAATAMADILGIEIIAIEEHSTTTISEMESLTRVSALHPDVIYISSTPQPASIIIKEARDIGLYPDVTIGVCHAGLVKSLIDLGGADVIEGVYGTFPTVMWGEDVPGMAKMMEYVKKLHPNDEGNLDYTAAWCQSLVVAEILRKALDAVGYDVLSKGDEAAWAAIEEYGFQGLDGYDVGGLQGAVKYNGAGDNRLTKYNRIYQVVNGVIGNPSAWIESPLIRYEDYEWYGN